MEQLQGLLEVKIKIQGNLQGIEVSLLDGTSAKRGATSARQSSTM